MSYFGYCGNIQIRDIQNQHEYNNLTAIIQNNRDDETLTLAQLSLEIQKNMTTETLKRKHITVTHLLACRPPVRVCAL
jgi:hypothetical protein